MSTVSEEIEFDESYCVGRCKGISGCDAACKVLVFGLLKRNGYIHAEIIQNATKTALVPILREKLRPHCLDHTDIFRAYDLFEERLVLVELHNK